MVDVGVRKSEVRMIVIWECGKCRRSGESEVEWLDECEELIGKEWDECVEKVCDGMLEVRGIGVKRVVWICEMVLEKCLMGSWGER